MCEILNDECEQHVDDGHSFFEGGLENDNIGLWSCNLCGKTVKTRSSLYVHRHKEHRDAVRKYSKI